MKQNLKSEFEDELRHQTLKQTKTINLLRQQVNQLGVQLQQQQASPNICTQYNLRTPPLLDTAPTSQPPPHHFGQNVSMTNNSLAEVMDVLK